MRDSNRTPTTGRTAGAAASVLIVLSLVLQALAASRLLCPPNSLESLAALRVACAPVLWPFIDYPMFSEVHRRGDSLAWLEATLERPAGRSAPGLAAPGLPRGPWLFQVHRSSPAESWRSAFEREELLARDALARELGAASVRGGLRFERYLTVLTESGLAAIAPDVPPDTDR